MMHCEGAAFAEDFLQHYSFALLSLSMNGAVQRAQIRIAEYPAARTRVFGIQFVRQLIVLRKILGEQQTKIGDGRAAADRCAVNADAARVEAVDSPIAHQEVAEVQILLYQAGFVMCSQRLHQRMHDFIGLCGIGLLIPHLPDCLCFSDTFE